MINSSINLMLILVASVCAAPEKSHDVHSTSQNAVEPSISTVGYNVHVPTDIAKILKKYPDLGITVPSPVPMSGGNLIEVHIPADQVRFLYTKYEPKNKRQAKLEAWIKHIKTTSSRLEERNLNLADLFNKIYKMKPSDAFKEMLKNDGYKYVIKSITFEPLRVDFPNLPDWHKDKFEERRDILPDSKVIRFEYNGSNYKLLVNTGSWHLTNFGSFGALYDERNERIGNLETTGDMETTIKSIKSQDAMIERGLLVQLPPYLNYFHIKFYGSTQLEYLIFKILAENECLFCIDGIGEKDCSDSDDED